MHTHLVQQSLILTYITSLKSVCTQCLLGDFKRLSLGGYGDLRYIVHDWGDSGFRNRRKLGAQRNGAKRAEVPRGRRRSAAPVVGHHGHSTAPPRELKLDTPRILRGSAPSTSSRVVSVSGYDPGYPYLPYLPGIDTG